MQQHRKLAKEIHRLDVGIGRCLQHSGDLCHTDEVSCTNARIIRFLTEREDRDIYQRDLEKEFGITRSTASRVLLLMEQKGMVERHSVPSDARLKKLVLTQKSRCISERMMTMGREVDQKLLSGFTEEETAQLFTFLDRMMDNLK